MAGDICIHKILIASMLTILLHHFHQMFEDSYSIASHTLERSREETETETEQSVNWKCFR